jgi:LmbE family N-acetylglucosaminyl deacetylase
MKRNQSARRKFIKLSTLGLGGMILSAADTLKTRGQNDIPGEKEKLNIICVGAHPGDPEFGCGGTMAKYSDAGNNVTFLYLTRGEAGDPTKTFTESASLRTKEAEISCKILNAKPIFAGQVDANTELNKETNEQMTKLILSQKPDMVFTHWPLDAHQDHQVAGLLALTAWIRSKKKFHLYFYEVNTGSETMAFVPTDYVDITNLLERKKNAMFAHKTQDPVQVYNDYFKTLQEFRGLEAGVKAAEAFIHFKTPK